MKFDLRKLRILVLTVTFVSGIAAFLAVIFIHFMSIKFPVCRRGSR